MTLTDRNAQLYSPFRYPGGKSWLVPVIRHWITQLHGNTTVFCEPFAGGAIVGLTVLFEDLCDRLILVEKDGHVASVWHTILSSDVAWLCDRVASFELTAQGVNDELAHRPQTTKELAFQTILRNRVNRGGIIARRAGRLKNGEKGKGIASRWYPDTICRRMRAIHDRRDRIDFIHGDGLHLMERYATKADTAWFLDPPYTVGGTNPGNRLYTHSDVDHDRLFKLAVSLAGEYLITYSDSDEVRELARWHQLQLCRMRMKTTHHRNSAELLIGKKLDWLSIGTAVT